MKTLLQALAAMPTVAFLNWREGSPVKLAFYHELGHHTQTLLRRQDVEELIKRYAESQQAGAGDVALSEKLAAQAARPVEPAKGFAIVPIHPNREMERVFQEEGWEWRDVLAAANAITEEEYNTTPPDTAAELERLRALSVENILLAVVPGDGSGHEVYAKTVDDVKNTLTCMGSRLEDQESELLRRQDVEELIKRYAEGQQAGAGCVALSETQQAIAYFESVAATTESRDKAHWAREAAHALRMGWHHVSPSSFVEQKPTPANQSGFAG